MNYTTNYQLPQWVKEDRIMMEDFNDMAAKVDEALGEQGKTLADHTALLAGVGNCAVYMANYTGNGKLKTMSHTFPHKPIIVMIMSLSTELLDNGRDIIACQGKTIPIVGFENLIVAWSENTMSWTYTGSAEISLNVNKCPYQIIALLDADT